jgi:putative endonuclease
MTLVARNWRNPIDQREEIDLVLRDGASLVFVEVKARAAGARVPGLYAVGPAKRAVLRRAVRAYLAGLPGGARPLRFDVIEVEVESDRRPADWIVRHYPNVPLFAADVRG